MIKSAIKSLHFNDNIHYKKIITDNAYEQLNWNLYCKLYIMECDLSMKIGININNRLYTSLRKDIHKLRIKHNIQ